MSLDHTLLSVKLNMIHLCCYYKINVALKQAGQGQGTTSKTMTEVLRTEHKQAGTQTWLSPRRWKIWFPLDRELPCNTLARWHTYRHHDSSKVNHTSVQFSAVAQSCPTPCDPMNRSTPGLPVQHQLPESTHSHVHWVGDAIQPSHPLVVPISSGLQSFPASESFQWVSSSH